MKLRSKMFVVGGLLAIVALWGLIGSAAGSSITPAGDTLLGTSSEITFAIGESTITCTFLQFSGTIPTKAATMSIGTPSFQASNGTECSTGTGTKTVVSTFNNWSLKAFGTSEAGLALPSTESLLLHPEPSCTVYNSGESVPAGAYVTATKTSPVSHSAMVLAAGKITVKASGAGCSAKMKEVTTVWLTGSVIVNDLTHPETVVAFE